MDFLSHTKTVVLFDLFFRKGNNLNIGFKGSNKPSWSKIQTEVYFDTSFFADTGLISDINFGWRHPTGNTY